MILRPVSITVYYGHPLMIGDHNLLWGYERWATSVRNFIPKTYSAMPDLSKNKTKTNNFYYTHNLISKLYILFHWYIYSLYTNTRADKEKIIITSNNNRKVSLYYILQAGLNWPWKSNLVPAGKNMSSLAKYCLNKSCPIGICFILRDHSVDGHSAVRCGQEKGKVDLFLTSFSKYLRDDENYLVSINWCKVRSSHLSCAL